MKGIILNLVIAALVILSLFQTARLWFGPDASSNILNIAATLLQREQDEDKLPEKARLIAPYRIIAANSGEDKTAESYATTYALGEIAALRRYGDEIIHAMFESGEFIREYNAQEHITGLSDFVLYDYAFSLPASVFTQAFPQRQKQIDRTRTALLTSKMRAFNRIAILSNDVSQTLVVFIDDTRGLCYEYTAPAPAHITDRLSEVAAALFSNENAAPAAALSTRGIQAVNPFMSADGVITLRSVERALRSVFGANPINQASPDDIYLRFANVANIVCRYNLAAHTIDFTDYSLQSAAANELIPNFAAAMRFLETDESLSPVFDGLYLIGYDAATDEHTFRFSCRYGGARVIITEEARAAADMPSYIEITVQNQKTIKYRRFAHVFKDEDTAIEIAAIITDAPPFDTVHGFVFDGGSQLWFR